jgi:hypothetical protein
MDVPTRQWVKDDWNSPPEIVEAARRALGGRIVLDPFSNPWALMIAPYKLEVDGLTPWRSAMKTWFPYVSVPQNPSAFVNGPWSKNKEVVLHCVEQWMAGWEIVQVTPTSTNSSYWHLIEEAPAVCVPSRRIAFLKEGKPCSENRQDCVVVYRGSDPWRFRQAFRELGRVRFG